MAYLTERTGPLGQVDPNFASVLALGRASEHRQDSIEDEEEVSASAVPSFGQDASSFSHMQGSDPQSPPTIHADISLSRPVAEYNQDRPLKRACLAVADQLPCGRHPTEGILVQQVLQLQRYAQLAQLLQLPQVARNPAAEPTIAIQLPPPDPAPLRVTGSATSQCTAQLQPPASPSAPPAAEPPADAPTSAIGHFHHRFQSWPQWQLQERQQQPWGLKAQLLQQHAAAQPIPLPELDATADASAVAAVLLRMRHEHNTFAARLAAPAGADGAAGGSASLVPPLDPAPGDLRYGVGGRSDAEEAGDLAARAHRSGGGGGGGAGEEGLLEDVELLPEVQVDSGMVDVGDGVFVTPATAGPGISFRSLTGDRDRDRDLQQQQQQRDDANAAVFENVPRRPRTQAGRGVPEPTAAHLKRLALLTQPSSSSLEALRQLQQQLGFQADGDGSVGGGLALANPLSAAVATVLAAAADGSVATSDWAALEGGRLAPAALAAVLAQLAPRIWGGAAAAAATTRSGDAAPSGAGAAAAKRQRPTPTPPPLDHNDNDSVASESSAEDSRRFRSGGGPARTPTPPPAGATAAARTHEEQWLLLLQQQAARSAAAVPPPPPGRVGGSSRRKARPLTDRQRPSSGGSDPGLERPRGESGGSAACPPPPRPPRNHKGPLLCANCSTTQTPLWRKDRETGETVCNACGIYKQTHGFDRPVNGRQSAPQHAAGRKRHAALRTVPTLASAATPAASRGGTACSPSRTPSLPPDDDAPLGVGCPGGVEVEAEGGRGHPLRAGAAAVEEAVRDPSAIRPACSVQGGGGGGGGGGGPCCSEQTRLSSQRETGAGMEAERESDPRRGTLQQSESKTARGGEDCEGGLPSCLMRPSTMPRCGAAAAIDGPAPSSRGRAGLPPSGAGATATRSSYDGEAKSSAAPGGDDGGAPAQLMHGSSLHDWLPYGTPPPSQPQHQQPRQLRKRQRGEWQGLQPGACPAGGKGGEEEGLDPSGTAAAPIAPQHEQQRRPRREGAEAGRRNGEERFSGSGGPGAGDVPVAAEGEGEGKGRAPGPAAAVSAPLLLLLGPQARAAEGGGGGGKQQEPGAALGVALPACEGAGQGMLLPSQQRLQHQQQPSCERAEVASGQGSVLSAGVSVPVPPNLAAVELIRLMAHSTPEQKQELLEVLEGRRLAGSREAVAAATELQGRGGPWERHPGGGDRTMHHYAAASALTAAAAGRLQDVTAAPPPRSHYFACGGGGGAAVVRRKPVPPGNLVCFRLPNGKLAYLQAVTPPLPQASQLYGGCGGYVDAPAGVAALLRQEAAGAAWERQMDRERCFGAADHHSDSEQRRDSVGGESGDSVGQERWSYGGSQQPQRPRCEGLAAWVAPPAAAAAATRSSYLHAGRAAGEHAEDMEAAAAAAAAAGEHARASAAAQAARAVLHGGVAMPTAGGGGCGGHPSTSASTDGKQQLQPRDHSVNGGGARGGGGSDDGGKPAAPSANWQDRRQDQPGVMRAGQEAGPESAPLRLSAGATPQRAAGRANVPSPSYNQGPQQHLQQPQPEYADAAGRPGRFVVGLPPNRAVCDLSRLKVQTAPEELHTWQQRRQRASAAARLTDAAALHAADLRGGGICGAGGFHRYAEDPRSAPAGAPASPPRFQPGFSFTTDASLHPDCDDGGAPAALHGCPKPYGAARQPLRLDLSPSWSHRRPSQPQPQHGTVSNEQASMDARVAGLPLAALLALRAADSQPQAQDPHPHTHVGLHKQQHPQPDRLLHHHHHHPFNPYHHLQREQAAAPFQPPQVLLARRLPCLQQPQQQQQSGGR